MTERRNKVWNSQDYAVMQTMIAAGDTVTLIARALGRSREAVSRKASELHLKVSDARAVTKSRIGDRSPR